MIIYKYIISILIWMPVILGISIKCKIFKNFTFNKYFSINIMIVNILICIFIYLQFDNSLIFLEKFLIINFYYTKIYYHLSLDSLSFLFIFLSNFAGLIISIYLFNLYKIKNIKKNKFIEYNSIILIIIGLSNAIFSVQNTLLFYIFLEILTIFITFVLLTQKYNKISFNKGIQYFLYNILGSILLLPTFIYIQSYVNQENSIDIDTFSFDNFIISFNYIQNIPNAFYLNQIIIPSILLISFLIKLPIWPMHSWYININNENPSNNIIGLTLIIIKIGAYCLLRFILPIIFNFPSLLINFIILLSVFSIIYCSMIILSQISLKKMIVYSSLSHMSVIVLSLVIIAKNFNYQNINCVNMIIHSLIFQTIFQGLITTGIIICFDYLYFRTKVKTINKINGVTIYYPILSLIFMFLCLANIGFPGTTTFVSEVLLMFSFFNYSFIIASFLGLYMILTTAYTLVIYKNLFWGENKSKIYSYKDLSNLEIFILLLIIVPILIVGLYPNIIYSLTYSFSNKILKNIITLVY